jgi:carotenoid cleavage dioxygenase
MPIASLTHAFVVTERHLVIPLPPFVHDPQRRGKGVSYLDTHVWRPELGTQVMIVPKDDLSAVRLVDMPAGFVFHYGNGWEGADGTLRLDCCWYADASVVTSSLSGFMRGAHDPGSPSLAAVVEIAPGARSGRLGVTGINGEFPIVDPRLVTRRNRFVYTVGNPDGASGLAQVSRLVRHDIENGATVAFDYGDGVIAEEHLFIPRAGAGAEEAGWLIGTSLDYRRGRTRLAVFDAGQIGNGPVALASLPFAMPIGFHGCFAVA